MKVSLGTSVKRPGPAASSEPDPKAVRECAMELRTLGDLLNLLQLLLNTVTKMFPLST